MKIRRILDNIEIKLICLALAIVMWLYANGITEIMNKASIFIPREERNIITFHEVPIELAGAKDKEKFTTIPNKVSLSVTCVTTADINTSDFILKINTTKNDKSRIILSEDNVKLPDGLKFVRAEPEAIKIISKK